jgi:hypothetical protein
MQTMKVQASVLDEVEHERIIADMPGICGIAGLQPRFLRESMTVHCHNVEVDWVRKFTQYRYEGLPGLLLDGVENS